MTAVITDEKIPNNVNLAGDRRLQRALEEWQPHFLSWWQDMGPVGFQAKDVYLRTAVSVEADGWAHFDYVKMPDYRWGIFLEPKQALNIGSVGLKLALIALGERDLYVNPFPKCKAWDTCAPEAILHAAGGRLTDTLGDPVRYDQTDLSRPRGLVASNGHVHAASLARLASLFPRR